eukprot:227615-Pelagomonas_calceolata.AAC.1
MQRRAELEQHANQNRQGKSSACHVADTHWEFPNSDAPCSRVGRSVGKVSSTCMWLMFIKAGSCASTNSRGKGRLELCAPEK